MQKLLYVTPHLSTGGAPQYLLQKIELLKKEYNIFVIEFQDFGIYRVQKNRIIELLDNELITLGENKHELLDHIKQIQPDIIHFEEMPELSSIDDEIVQQIYTEDREYLIFETSHDSSFSPDSKRFLPDKFLFCSDNQLLNFRKLEHPTCVIEYPTHNYKRPNRAEALRSLGLDPSHKHVLNVGLFTSRKNQAEIFEYAKRLEGHKIQFHFIGNQAPNFKDYWEPLMNDKPQNCNIWGERNDTDRFYSCMDLFLFTSKGNAFDKETNPLVLKEAMSWNIPILMHKIDTYQDKYDKKATYLSEDININVLKLLQQLEVDTHKYYISCDYDGNVTNPEGTKIHLGFDDPTFEALKDKLVIISDAKSKLCIMRSSIMSQHMFVWPTGFVGFYNGVDVSIYDLPLDYFSNLNDINQINKHNLILHKVFKFDRSEEDVVIHDKPFAPVGVPDDPSSWFTMSEVFLSMVYEDLGISKNDIVLDVGAHFGFFSLYALTQKAKKIYSIEPSSSNFDILCQNVGRFKEIVPINLALDKEIAQREFIVVGPSATNSFHESHNNDENNSISQGKRKIETVNTVDFNSFIRNNNLSRIDAIKMDCEGAEWDLLPAISDDFFKYKTRKLTFELHQFNSTGENREQALIKHEQRCNDLQKRLENLGYEVKMNLMKDHDVVDRDGLGQLWAKRYPRIKVVHMLCTTEGSREKESIKHVNELLTVSDWEYEQSMNKRFTDLPPVDTCARPDVVQMEPGDYKLTGAHYGNYMAHRRVFEKHMTDDYDAILFCECDAIFIKPPEEVFKIIIDSYDDLMYNDLNYMSFGKRIPDWHYDEHEDFGITDRMSEAHCYLVPTTKRQYFIEKFESTGWDTYDLWLNSYVFPDKKCGIIKEPISIQCSGDSYLDKSHKDGTTLLKEGDITYEL